MSKEVGLREAWQLLMGAQSLVLVSHVGPDGDTLGSTLGLARALGEALAVAMVIGWETGAAAGG